MIGRDSLGREQRENPGLVLEWIEQEQGVGPPGQRQSRQRAERGSWSCSYGLSRIRNWNKMGEKVTLDDILNYHSPISPIYLLCYIFV